MNEYIKFFRNRKDEYTKSEVQLITNFCFGIIFAPTSNNILYTIMYYIISEIFFVFMGYKINWFQRMVNYIFYGIGFIFSKMLINKNNPLI